MPATRSQKNENFLSLSLVKSKKRKIFHDDSIVLTKKQKRVALKKRKENINNVSISSDHNNDYDVGTLASDDDIDVQAHKSQNVVFDIIEKPVNECNGSDHASPPSDAINSSNVTIASDDDAIPTAHNKTVDTSNTSFEIEEVGGNVELDFEKLDDSDEEEPIEKQFVPRGKNKVYVLIDEFDTKEVFDQYWISNDFDALYYHHSERSTYTGSEDIFRCKFYNKSGYEKCNMQAKTVFPGASESVFLYLTNDEHMHGKVRKPSKDGRFTWKSQPDAEEILIVGVEHNDFPSQILRAMDAAGIKPLPSMSQINNKIANIRNNKGLNSEITTKRELENILKTYTDIPAIEDADEPFVKDYKIEVLPCGRKARFWFLITTRNLLKRLKDNPLKIFQIDGTYKLIWVPEKQKEGWCVQVFGTSNLVNDFFPAGLAVTSEETAETYEEIILSLDTCFKFLMADGARAISRGKWNATKPTDETIINVDGLNIDIERGMCYPHVQRNIKKKLAGLEKNLLNEILSDVSTIQLSRNRN